MHRRRRRPHRGAGRRRRQDRRAGSGRRRRLSPRRTLRDELTDLPNIVSLVRIALLPLVLVFIDNYSRVLSFVAAMIFTVGALTDWLDGWLARKRGQVSVLGMFLDPLADKLFVLGTLVYLVARDRVPEWLVILLMSRELAITVLRGIAATYGLVIPAKAGGKTKTALQTVGIVFLLIHFRYRILLFDGELDFHRIGMGLIYVSLFMSLWSAGEYVRFFVRALEAKEARDKGGV